MTQHRSACHRTFLYAFKVSPTSTNLLTAVLLKQIKLEWDLLLSSDVCWFVLAQMRNFNQKSNIIAWRNAQKILNASHKRQEYLYFVISYKSTCKTPSSAFRHHAPYLGIRQPTGFGLLCHSRCDCQKPLEWWISRHLHHRLFYCSSWLEGAPCLW
jgi:hypothetical protein